MMEKDQQGLNQLPEGAGSAEERLEKENRAETLGSRDECQNLIQELQVRQIELERENDDLKKALSDFARMELYNPLFDFAPAGYFFLERSGTIRQVNQSGARLLGAERVGLVGRPFHSFVPDDSRPVFTAFLDKVIESRVMRILRVDASERGGAAVYCAH